MVHWGKGLHGGERGAVLERRYLCPDQLVGDDDGEYEMAVPKTSHGHGPGSDDREVAALRGDSDDAGDGRCVDKYASEGDSALQGAEDKREGLYVGVVGQRDKVFEVEVCLRGEVRHGSRNHTLGGQ
jgi:hypothetical protein